MSLTNPLSQETAIVGRIVTSSVTSTSDVIYAQFEDKKTGEAREPQSNTLLFTLSKDSERFEMIWAESHSTSGGITTINIKKDGSGNVIGRNLLKYGNLSGGATGNKHPINSEIGCAEIHIPLEIINEIIRGNEGTGSNDFKLGDESTSSNKRYYAWDGSTTPPFFEYDESTKQWLYSNDGISTLPVGGGTGSITAGDGIDITAGVVSVKGAIQVSATDTTPGYSKDKTTFVAGNGINITETTLNPSGNEVRQVEIEATSNDSSVDNAYTASEGIEAGRPVSKTTIASEVENTVLSTFSDAGTESTFNAAASAFHSSIYVSDNKVAVMYETSSKWYIIVGEIDVDKSVTWGTAVEVNSSANGGVDMVYIEDDKIAICYVENSTSDLYAQIVSISGTVPTLGTASLVHNTVSGTMGYCSLSLVDTDKLIVAYVDGADSNKGKAKAATFSGTTIGTWGSAVTFETGATKYISLSKFDTDKAGVFYQDDDDSDKGKGALLVATGTSLAANTPVVFENVEIAMGISSAQLTTDKVIVTYEQAGAALDECVAIIASLSGLTITYGSSVAVNSANIDPDTSVIAISSTEAYVGYEERASSDGKFNKLSISGTTITVGTQYTFNGSTNDVSYISLAKVSDKSKFIICYRDEADSNKGNAEVFQEYDNIDKCIGFAQSTVNATESVNIRSKGIDSNQSGLTTGTVYYVKTGGIESTNNSGLRAGVAKSTTSLDIDIDLDNGMSKEDADTLTDGSDASSLHTHSTLIPVSNAGQGTRAAATGSGTEIVTHGLGKTPKQIIFFAVDNNASGNSNGVVDDDGDGMCVYTNVGSSTGGNSSSEVIRIGSGADGQRATIGSITSTSFTLSWTKDGAGRDISYTWIALA